MSGPPRQRLRILTTPELARGYRLAGVETSAVEGPSEAARQLREALEAPHETGILALHEPYLEALEEGLRRRADASLAPLVVPLPPGDADARRSDRQTRLLRLLSQAVGFEITFGREEEA